MAARALAVATLICAAASARAEDGAAALARFLEARPRIAAELAEPVARCVARHDTAHPAFHGCIDWHSAAHGIWALIAYARMTGDRRYLPLVETNLTPANVAAERRFLRDQPGFEMPYGRAWFLRLAIDHERLYRNGLLRPMADEVAASLIAHYRAAPPDPWSRAYRSASWALANLHDYARFRGDGALAAEVEALIRTRFASLSGRCPLEPEDRHPPDFMALCTNIAWLVARVLPREEYRAWLVRFLPPDLAIDPVTRPRRSHHYGRNFSRAWGLWGIFRASGEPRFRNAYLAHFNQSYQRRDWWDGGYHAVGHWVAQFGIYALAVTAEGR